MSAHEVVFVGGPFHGDRYARPGSALDAPLSLTFDTWNDEKVGTATYSRAADADTPGAIAYVFAQEGGEANG